MYSIFDGMIRTATRHDEWSAPPSWKEDRRGPESERQAKLRHRAELRHELGRAGQW